MTSSHRSPLRRERTEQSEKDLDWARQMTHLLSHLQDRLSATVEAWNSFASPDGDILYFDNPNAETISPAADRSLQALKSIFREVEEKRRRLVHLRDLCTNHTQCVSQSLVQFLFSEIVIIE